MALNIDSRMYSGGAVELDGTPVVNMYAQLLARKQAKMDALDEYDRNRINNINPNGVRDVDREGFDKRVQQIQEFYQGNKEKIRKGGTPESYAYEKMFRDVGSYINQSKERTAKQDAAMKLYQDRLKQDGRIPDDFIAELGENDSAIDKLTGIDPQTGKPRNSKSLDLTKWLSQPKPFNQQTYLKGFSDVKRDKVSYSGIPNEPLKQNEITAFGKDALSVIHARAADKYQNSFSFAEQVKAEFADPVARKQMEETFVKQYGTAPQTMDDYAAAFTLKLLQPELVKAIDNKQATIDYKFDNQKTLAAIKQLYATANIKLAAGVRNTSTGEMTPPPKDGENYDLTERFQGLKVGNLAGTPEVAQIGSKIIYNPNSKTVTYKDFAGNEKTKSFQQFYDDIATINTVQDLKIVKEVMNSIESPKTVQKNNPVAPAKKKVYNPKTGKFE